MNSLPDWGLNSAERAQHRRDNPVVTPCSNAEAREQHRRHVEGGERVGAVVAPGEAEIGFQQISELLAVDGIDFVGPLPAEVQRATMFSAGVGAATTCPAVAKSNMQMVCSPSSSTGRSHSRMAR